MDFEKPNYIESEDLEGNNQKYLETKSGGLLYIPEFLHSADPLITLGSLETRDFRQGNTLFTVYNPQEKDDPLGLGKWSEGQFSRMQNVLGEVSKRYPAQPGWVEKPSQGDYVVLKLSHLDDYSNQFERAAYLKLNRLFPSNARCRPIRLLGYGVVSDSGFDIGIRAYDRSRFSYQLLEYIPPNFFQLGDYFSQNRQVDLPEVVKIISGVGSILNIIHSARLTQGDLQSVGVLQHVYWDPQAQQIRIIDWNRAQDNSIPAIASQDIIRGHYSMDQASIGDILKASLVGGLENKDWVNVIQGKYPARVSEAIIQFIKRTSGVSKEDQYSLNPKGTQDLCNDIARLSALVGEI
jgi:hypothetical protein